MRKASMILGIIGGAIAILIGAFAMMGGMMFKTVYPDMMDEAFDQADLNEIYSEDVAAEFENFDLDEASRVGGNVFMGLGSVILFAGIIGLIGGIIVKRNNVAAGIMMLISAVICMFTVWGLFAFIILLLGGIFALVRDKSAPNIPVYTGNMQY